MIGRSNCRYSTHKHSNQYFSSLFFTWQSTGNVLMLPAVFATQCPPPPPVSTMNQLINQHNSRHKDKIFEQENYFIHATISAVTSAWSHSFILRDCSRDRSCSGCCGLIFLGCIFNFSRWPAVQAHTGSLPRLACSELVDFNNLLPPLYLDLNRGFIYY